VNVLARGASRHFSAVGALCALAVLSLISCAGNEPLGAEHGPLASGSSPAGQAVTLQLLTVSDWHGQLDPLSVSNLGNVGGASALSSYFKADRAANPNTLTLTAGDAFGGSPPLSNFFAEEPAVKAMNLMGFDVDALGNHNFDRGIAHLQSMIDLAEFSYVAANLAHLEENLSGVSPWVIKTVGGVKVGIVGVTNDDAHHLVFPGSFGTIHIEDPVSSANKARAAAQAAGAQVMVALVHMGATGADPATGQLTGPLIDFANDVGGFDVIVGDHTDILVNTVINNAIVIENRSKGRTYARIQLTVSPLSGKVSSKSAQFVTPVTADVPADPAIDAMLAPYRSALSAAYDVPVAVTTGIFVRGSNVERLEEVAIGNLLTDAIRNRYGTQVAFTNGGGIRAPLPSSYLPADTTLRRTSSGYAAGPPYDLVVGDVYTVLPFGNVVVTRTVTGAQLWTIMEHGLGALPAASGRFPQISGFTVEFDTSLPPGARVKSITLAGGTPVLADATPYTLATNDFVNAGGDGYTMLVDGQGTTREVMADVVLQYLKDQGTLTPTTSGRLVDVKTP
jgi:5'-nucleotidase